MKCIVCSRLMELYIAVPCSSFVLMAYASPLLAWGHTSPRKQWSCLRRMPMDLIHRAWAALHDCSFWVFWRCSGWTRLTQATQRWPKIQTCAAGSGKRILTLQLFLILRWLTYWLIFAGFGSGGRLWSSLYKLGVDAELKRATRPISSGQRLSIGSPLHSFKL